MTSFDNYLFDLYGTLVDIRTDEEQTPLWEHMAALLGMDGAFWDAQELKAHYFTSVDRAQAAAQALLHEPDAQAEIDLLPVFRSFYTLRGLPAADSRLADLAKVFRRLSTRHLCLYDGAADLLQRLHNAGKRVFLLSNAQVMFTVPELRLLGIYDAFDGILLSSDFGRKKPDPAFFLQLLRRYGLNASRTVMVGNDDLADCHGAAAAGLSSRYIPTEISPLRHAPLPAGCVELSSIREVF